MSKRLEHIPNDNALPDDAVLPKYSMKPQKMGMTHQEWGNTILDRYMRWYESTGSTAVQKFAQVERGNNSVQIMRVLTGYVLEAAGYDGDYREDNTMYPVALTEAGASTFVERYRDYCRPDPERPARSKAVTVDAPPPIEPDMPPAAPAPVEAVEAELASRAQQIGEYVLEHKLLLYDAANAQMLDPDQLFPPGADPADSFESK